MGLFGKKPAVPQFESLDQGRFIAPVEADVGVARAKRDAPVELSKSTREELTQQQLDRAVALGAVDRDTARQIQESIQRQQQFGSSAGQAERAARRGQQLAAEQSQSTRSLFDRLATDTRVTDLQRQERFKEQATLALPGISAIPGKLELERINQANLAKAAAARAEAIEKNRKKAAAGALVGGAAGLAFTGGNPMGGAMGAGMGSSLFTAFA